MSVNLLILGAGWTANFLIPLLKKEGISYAATSRSGRPGTIAFEFHPESDNTAQFESLPDAKAILITFPIIQGASRLVQLYNKSRRHDGKLPTQWIQLGTTGLWNQGTSWQDRHSEYQPTNRSKQEEELLESGPATILHLSGLWGSGRDPRNWVPRVAPTKEALSQKAGSFVPSGFAFNHDGRMQGSLHLIHGEDVACSVLAVYSRFDKAVGQRWIVTDQRVYDWWDLASSWANDGPASWVSELMRERHIRALPRPVNTLGRALDSTEFWETFNLAPTITLHSNLSSLVRLT